MNGGQNIKQAVPFFGVMNIALSAKFYTTIGFGMTLDWRPEGKLRWCNLTRGGASVMLQEFVHDSHESFVPAERLGVGVSVCFICDDALDLFEEFIEKGIAVTEPFVGNGMWVIELKDPDGYALCFESYTDVPEGTRHSDWKK